MKPITDELLIKIAGEAAFKRGQKLFEKGNVLAIETSKNHQLAKVQGSKPSQTYAVDIVHTPHLIQGSCNCLASDGVDFCKHCVAAVLHLKNGQAPLSIKSNADKLQATSKATAKQKQYQTIARYLSSLTKLELENLLLELIEQSPDLTTAWIARAENKLGLINFKALRKKITAALPYNRQLFYYDQVRNYFSKVEPLCEQIETNSLNLTEEELFKLAEYGLQRINKALDTIDDSGGFRIPSENFFYTLLANGFAEIKWEPLQKTAWLFNQYCSESKLGITLDDFYCHLNRTEQAQLNTLAQNAWQNLQSFNLFDYEQKISVFNLQALLIKFAEAHQDWQTIIRIYEKTASSFQDQIDQLEREIRFELIANAETRFTRLKKRVNNRSDKTELFKQEVKLAQYQQQTERKKQAQWLIYQASEKLEDLIKLLEWEPNLKKQTDFLKEAESTLLEHILSSQNKRFTLPADNLIDLYLYQSKNRQAYELVKEYPASEMAILTIAQHPETNFINAWQLFDKLIIRQLDLTNNQAYKQALILINHAATKVNNELEQQLFKKVVAELREEYKRKINFTKWLDELLPKLF